MASEPFTFHFLKHIHSRRNDNSMALVATSLLLFFSGIFITKSFRCLAKRYFRQQETKHTMQNENCIRPLVSSVDFCRCPMLCRRFWAFNKIPQSPEKFKRENSPRCSNFKVPLLFIVDSSIKQATLYFRHPSRDHR